MKTHRPQNHCFAARLVVSLLAIVSVGASQASSPDGFTPTTPLQTARTGHTATVLADGTVFVVGGMTYDAKFPSSTEIFDPGSSTWKFGTSASIGRALHTSTVLADGRILVAGGYTYEYSKFEIPYQFKSTILGSAEIYDPQTQKWTPTEPMNTARMGHCAALLPSGKVLVVGGEINGAFKMVFNPSAATGIWGGWEMIYGSGSVAEVYDPATNKWSNTGGEETLRVSPTATLLKDGRVLVAGGGARLMHDVETYSSAEVYDPIHEKWSPVMSMHSPRSEHTATLLPDGRVLMVGGDYPSAPEIYDPLHDKWTLTGPAPSVRVTTTATLLPKGKVLVVEGGYTRSSPGPLASAEIYDIATNTWTPTTYPANTGRFDHTASLLHDGSVLIVGGSVYTNIRPTDSVEIYNQGVLELPATSLFVGLVTPPDGVAPQLANEGFFCAMVNTNHTFSGKLTIDGQVFPLTGSFDLGGRAHFGVKKAPSLALKRKPKGKPVADLPDYVVDFKRDEAAALFNQTISGTVSAGGVVVATIHCSIALYDGKTPGTSVPPGYLGAAGSPGLYTLSFPSVAPAELSPGDPMFGFPGFGSAQTPGLTSDDYPQGAGIGTAAITKAGNVTVAAVLADGTALTASVPLTHNYASSSTTFPLFSLLYANAGYFTANVIVDHTNTESDMSLGLGMGLPYARWARPAIPGQFYPNGWPQSIVVDLQGAMYFADRDKILPTLAQPSDLGNATLDIESGLLPSAFIRNVNLGKRGAVAKVNPADKTFATTAVDRQGRFAGSFAHANGTKPMFRAIVYQKGANAGAKGFFLATAPKGKTGSGKSGVVKLVIR